MHKLKINVYKMVLNPTNYDLNKIGYKEWIELKDSLMQTNTLKAMEDIRKYLYSKQ